MVTTTPNGNARVDEAGDPGAVTRLAQPIRRMPTPEDVVPRLIGLGVSVDTAQGLAEQHGEQRVADVLDAFEVLDADRRILDPVGWIDAAAQHRWDLTGALAERREREQRLAAIEADRQRRETAGSAHPVWRGIADRWDMAISAALDDEQLGRAINLLTDEVPGIGRRSLPLVRAELIAWAVDVHQRDDRVPLDQALTEDLAAGPQPPQPRTWPLPEPPAASADDVRPLASRIAQAIGADVGRVPSAAVEISVPHRTVWP